MPRKANQKLKLLRIMELLRDESSARHPLTTRRLCSLLTEEGIPCERRTLSKDLALLTETGYDIVSVMRGHEKAYYLAGEQLTLKDRRDLSYAAMAAPFLTQTRCDELVQKLDAGEGKTTFYCDVHRTDREELTELLHKLQRDADLGSSCQIEYREPGRQPVSLVLWPQAILYQDGLYYLFARSAKEEAAEILRVDYILSVKGAVLPPESREEHGKVTEDELLDLLSGPRQRVVLQFDRELTGAVRDRFGNDVRLEAVSEDSFTAKLLVRTDSRFWGWLFSFSGRIQLVQPQELAMKYMSWCEVIAQSIAEGILEETSNRWYSPDTMKKSP